MTGPAVDLDLSATLVVGLGVTGRAVAVALERRGHRVIVADDRPGNAAASATDLGLVVQDANDGALLAKLVDEASAVVPSPGVPRHHDIYRLADERARPIVSELDLAAIWDDRPIAAVTGTNGKTTVTTMVTAMLRRSGMLAEAVGNTETPLVEAIDFEDPRPEAFVVEASSFRLERTERFAPKAAAWLNLAPDHLDWHGDFESYAAAKARIWRHQGVSDVAVVPLGDEAVTRWLPAAGPQVVTFGGPGADVAVTDEGRIIAHGATLASVSDMRRARPHDLANGCAAAAVALAMGAASDAVADELREFSGLPHRLQAVRVIDGVTFHNDSKATAPHATLAALDGFERVVLIAGGRNKDLDLSELAQAAPRLEAVVAIGEAASEIEAVFAGANASTDSPVPTVHADTMTDAVHTALRLARDSRDVVLSPACASFDWYRSYEERGDDFRRIVIELADARPTPASPTQASPAPAAPDKRTG